LTASVVGPALPQPISREVALVVGGHIEVLGGRTSAKVSTDEVVRWEPGGAATVVGHLARRVHDSAGVVLGGRALLFGGGDGGSVADVQAFDGSTATKVGSLGVGRSDVSAAAIGGTAYVIGGFDDSNGVLEVSSTSDGRSFRKVAALPRTIRYGAAIAEGSKLLVFGGDDGTTSSDSVLLVDPAKGTTNEVARLPVRLSHAVAFTLDGSIFVAGGETDGARTDVIYRYDPTGRSFAIAGRLPGPRSDAGAVVVGHTAYVIGGEGPGTLGDVVALTAP
jgi:hypothetical protein